MLDSMNYKSGDRQMMGDSLEYQSPPHCSHREICRCVLLDELHVCNYSVGVRRESSLPLGAERGPSDGGAGYLLVARRPPARVRIGVRFSPGSLN